MTHGIRHGEFLIEATHTVCGEPPEVRVTHTVCDREVADGAQVDLVSLVMVAQSHVCPRGNR